MTTTTYTAAAGSRARSRFSWSSPLFLPLPSAGGSKARRAAQPRGALLVIGVRALRGLRRAAVLRVDLREARAERLALLARVLRASGNS